MVYLLLDMTSCLMSICLSIMCQFVAFSLNNVLIKHGYHRIYILCKDPTVFLHIISLYIFLSRFAEYKKGEKTTLFIFHQEPTHTHTHTLMQFMTVCQCRCSTYCLCVIVSPYSHSLFLSLCLSVTYRARCVRFWQRIEDCMQPIQFIRTLSCSRCNAEAIYSSVPYYYSIKGTINWLMIRQASDWIPSLMLLPVK